MTNWPAPSRPLSIAHRGASAYAPANSLQAFQFADALNADMWEVDLRLTFDNKVIVFHDEILKCGRRIDELKYSEILTLTSVGEVPTFLQVLTLATERDAGIYADIKVFDAAEPVCMLLNEAGLKQVILGASDAAIITKLGTLNTPYPRAILVPIGVDPFEVMGDAEIIHLCWEHIDHPLALLDDVFFDRCKDLGKQVVLWHEEDSVRMTGMRKLPVLGIFSDQPELVNPFVPPADWPVEIVCHRGAKSVAPENSMSAARACFAAGFSHVELDVHVTRDRELVVMHDPALERTSSGYGLVTEHTLKELRSLSVGAWFSEHHRTEIIPTFSEILRLADDWNGKLYVELKSAPADLVWECVCEHNMQDSCFFWSFDAQLLQNLRQISDDANLMMRRQDFDNLDAALANLAPAIIEYTMEEDLSELTILRQRHIRSMIAYNGNDKDVFLNMASKRPDMVNLHKPFEFVKTIFEIGSVDV